MSVPYDYFLPEVLPFCPDVSEPSAINAIRNACMDLCDKSLVWHAPFTMDVVAGQNAYYPSAPLGARRNTFIRVWYNNRKLSATTPDYLTARYVTDWRTTNGDPHAFIEEQDAGLVLDQVPIVFIGAGLRGEQAFSPLRDSTEIGYDVIYEQWAEVIAAGALARLYMTVGSPYYQPKLAEMKARDFARGIDEVTNEVNYGNGRGNIAIQQRPFARGNTKWR